MKKMNPKKPVLQPYRVVNANGVVKRKFNAEGDLEAKKEFKKIKDESNAKHLKLQRFTALGQWMRVR